MSQTAAKKMGLTGVLVGQDVRVRRNLRDLNFLYLSVLSAFVLVCVALLFLWSRMTVIKTGYEISKANAARAALIDRNKRLRFELVKLKSPERIEKIASVELGLVHPTGERIVNIR